MKKIILKSIKFFSVILLTGSAVLLFSFFVHPFDKIAASALLGDIYKKAGKTELLYPDKKVPLQIFKKENKPFLILGPCPFPGDEPRGDFFFVNRWQVIRTATDKGGDCWYELGHFLFILDDMSNPHDRLREPWWDELQQKNTSVKYDAATQTYIYTFFLDPRDKPVSFSVPAELLTPDMQTVPNNTLHE